VVRQPAALLGALAGLAVYDLLAPYLLNDPGTGVAIAGLALISIPLATLVPRALAADADRGLWLLAAAVPAVAATAVLIWLGFSGTAATLTSTTRKC